MRKAEAAAAWARAVALDGSASNHLSLAEAAEANGDHKTAANSYLKLSELEKEKAAEHCERAYSLDPGNASIALAYARTLLESLRGEEALKIISPGATLPEAAVDFRLSYAQALIECTKTSEAQPVASGLFQQNSDRATEMSAVLSQLLWTTQTD